MKFSSAALGVLALFISQTALAFDHTHQTFTSVLKKFNKNGLVRYQALKTTPDELQQYLKTLNTVSLADFEKWTESQKIAFWINAYNAATLKAIIDHYPIKSSFIKSVRFPKNSIRQIDGVWDKIMFPLLGRKMTLEQIEHKELRAKFNEPRIHMALVCAALACPPLREEAFTEEKLEAQLNDQSRQFLSNSEKFKIDAQYNIVHLSAIFDWFGKDFIPSHGTQANFINKPEKERAVLSFISPFLKSGDQSFLISAEYKIEYYKYDWTLNEQK